MAYETYVAAPGASKTGVTVGSDAGTTNTLSAIVGAGNVALIVEDSVAGATNITHETLERIQEILREAG